jgi:hypothetical protein
VNLSGLDHLTALLQQVPSLVDLYGQKDPSFVPAVKDWCQLTERVLQSQRLPVVSKIAAFRGVILATERGSPPQGFSLSSRQTKRRLVEAVCLHFLHDAQAAILGVMSPHLERFSQAEQIVRNSLTVASRKGILNNSFQPPFTEHMLKALWKELISDESIGGGISQVLAMVGFRDGLNLLRRTLEAWAREFSFE